MNSEQKVKHKKFTLKLKQKTFIGLQNVLSFTNF